MIASVSEIVQNKIGFGFTAVDNLFKTAWLINNY